MALPHSCAPWGFSLPQLPVSLEELGTQGAPPSPPISGGLQKCCSGNWSSGLNAIGQAKDFLLFV